MVYKHKIRIFHIQEDLERGYIKTKEEYKQALEQFDKEAFIEHFLDEFDQNQEQEEIAINEGEEINAEDF